MPGTATGSASRSWNILCDFDGTVTPDDVIDGLLERFGRPGWQELEDDWRAGRIGSRECMQRQVELLDVSAAELDAYLDAVPIDPDFGDFVAAARRAGHRVSIVSDGIDYAIHRILTRHGLTDLPVAANRLEPGAADRRWRLASPFESTSCLSGTCKCELVQSARDRDDVPVLLIGDGRSDFCASQSADFVFAKSKLIEHCRTTGAAHSPVTGFAMVLGLLPQLEGFVPA
jgi:2-hydroxy-3-keto-5-methylthiopentenyl-1-phosphate phosphatase